MSFDCHRCGRALPTDHFDLDEGCCLDCGDTLRGERLASQAITGLAIIRWVGLIGALFVGALLFVDHPIVAGLLLAAGWGVTMWGPR